MRNTIDDDRVINIYGWYCDAMASAGAAQPARDPRTLTKTYQFRSLQKFADRAFNEWKLDDSSIRQYISTAIRYAKSNGLLSRGANLLAMDSVAKPTFDMMANRCATYRSVVDEVIESHKFIMGLGANNGEIDRALLRPIRHGGYQSIIYYNKIGKISSSYIALSKRCNRLMLQMPGIDRVELPKMLELKVIRIRLRSGDDVINKLRPIMGDDLVIE